MATTALHIALADLLMLVFAVAAAVSISNEPRQRIVPRWRLPMTAQLNVRNAFNSYLVGVGRYNATENGYLRVYLNEPRNYKFTLSTEF